jgi:hypothetical protein
MTEGVEEAKAAGQSLTGVESTDGEGSVVLQQSAAAGSHRRMSVGSGVTMVPVTGEV